jgi:hypothetical protein
VTTEELKQEDSYVNYADEMISTQEEEEKRVTKGIAVPLALLQSFYSVCLINLIIAASGRMCGAYPAQKHSFHEYACMLTCMHV